jgi:hypothetical protein
MENLQSKAHALHVVQPFLELVEDKIFNKKIYLGQSLARPCHSESSGDGSFSIS